MPVKISKVKGGYQVKTPNQVHAKKTSLTNAKAQERILNAVEHTDWRPTGKPAKKKWKQSGPKGTSLLG